MRPSTAIAAAALLLAAVRPAGGQCTADTDGDFLVGVEDLVSVVLDWGCTAPPGPCAGDVTGDGAVTLDDLLLVVESWGLCPGRGLCDPHLDTCGEIACAPGECGADACCTAACAAESGLALAAEVLASEGARFVITKGLVDEDYAFDLWTGSWDPADGAVTILPAQGYDGDPSVTSLLGAVRDAHDQAELPEPLPCPADAALPHVDPDATLRVRPVPLTAAGWEGPYFRLEYAILDDGGLRVTSQGIAGDEARLVHGHFTIEKRIGYALVSPSRVEIGKNVRIEGALATRFGTVPGELEDGPYGQQGDPLVMRSDFRDLDATLDGKLDTLYAQVAAHDVDGDARLDLSDPVEAEAVVGQADLVDHDGDGSIDDFDLFVGHYDADADGQVVYDAKLAGGLPLEFGGPDDSLGPLVDGNADGILNGLDLYAKVHGGLVFAVGRAAWEAAQGASYQSTVHGPIRTADPAGAPVVFEASERELPEVTTAMVVSGASWFAGAADGPPFAAQVERQLAAGGEYVPPGPLTWDDFPYGSSGVFDYYQRAIYREMTFIDVRIPKGTNALFESCTFVGVTYIETNEDCDHVNWNYTGAFEEIAPGVYELKFPDLVSYYGDGVEVEDTRTESNNLRFDGCTFLGSIAADQPAEYTHWRNALQLTGTTRFFLDGDDPDLAGEPDAAELQEILEGLDPADRIELGRSSIMLPGWWVRALTSGAPATRLRGTIVAGLAEARGRLEIDGTLLITFRPVEAQGPLFYGGVPGAFSTAIGHGGPDAGGPPFGAVTLRDDPLATMPDGIPWPLTVRPE